MPAPVGPDVPESIMANQAPPSLDSMVRNYINVLVKEILRAMAYNPRILSNMIDKVVIDAHEESLHRTRLAGLSSIIALDIDVSKLAKIRNLSQQFSRDVGSAWETNAGARNESSE
ncbi:hypothetical protein BGZ63DRAFT_429519 [Mariannaea sp. PMI_226]|nr:hypothetical protein BGZ63DRAFT_429519 [Mariannaea sp. PMI_226]